MKYCGLAILLLACLGLGGCVQEPTGNGRGEIIESAAYSLAEVGLHDSGDDCWLVIDGKVYDVTEFIPSHPGGNAILEGCGTDATELFETRPMGSGTPHSTGARLTRETYYLGVSV